ncbi:MAG: HipA domain-containing protein [Parachlamydiaceae bacterium]
MELATKLSVQGVQPKLSLKLNPEKELFEIVESGGTYILKPPHQIYAELPQNEDLTMKMASAIGLNVPLHGMIYNIDGSLSYWIKRFDRFRGKKLAVEDFSQLLGDSRDTKYESSMEKVIGVLEKYCTFPAIEKLKLFRLVFFNFLVGNEDMHLKNFSLIHQKDRIELSPCYDLLNSTIVLKKAKEEIALPIRGKKSNLNDSDIIEYFGQERLGLPLILIKKEMLIFEKIIGKWNELIEKSFLSYDSQKKYKDLIVERWKLFEKRK